MNLQFIVHVDKFCFSDCLHSNVNWEDGLIAISRREMSDSRLSSSERSSCTGQCVFTLGV